MPNTPDQTKRCRTVLIQDDPATSDDFGSHAPIADAIVRLVRNERGGVSLALEGNWGSGKSTIVNFCRQQLGEHPEIFAVVIFDAWAHEGDPLRRSFLEKLMNELVFTRKWSHDKDHWEQVKEALAKRFKEEERTQTPIVKPLGLFLALFALVAPFGLVLTSWALNNDHAEWVAPGIAMSLSPALLSALIILAAGIRYLLNLVKHRKAKTAAFLSELAALVMQKTNTQIVSQTRESPEPTSVEFANDFSDLMSDVLRQKERKVLLVLDNLDRVAPEDARSILATLQTFIQNPQYSREPWFSRIFILIPYDPSGLDRLWSANGGAEDEHLARQFIEKTFQIRFAVPPVSLSDWGDYLKTQFSSALPDHQEDDPQFHLAYRVYDLNRPKDTLPPTPRELKLFVNQVGALHRVVQDKLPLSHLAYFAVLTREGKSVIPALRAGSVPSRQMINLLGEGLTDSLASLAFNVDSDKARELLLQRLVTAALRKPDPDAILQLSDQHPKGVWLTVERVPFDEWTDSESFLLGTAASCLKQASVMDRAPAAVSRSIVAALAGAARSVHSWEPLGEELGQGLADLATLKPDPHLFRSLLSGLRASVAQPDDEEDESKVFQLWLQSLTPLALFGIHSELREHLPKGIVIPRNAEWFVNACFEYSKSDDTRDLITYLRTDSASDQITLTIVSSITDGHATASVVEAIETIMQIYPDINAKAIADAASARLANAGRTLPSAESGPLATLLWTLAQYIPDARKSLEALAGSDFTLHHLFNAYQEEDYKAASLFMLTHIHCRARPKAPEAPTGNMQQGWNLMHSITQSPEDNEEFMNPYTSAAEQFDELGRLIDISAKVTPWRGWCLTAIRLLILAQRGLELASNDQYLDHQQFLRTSLDADSYSKLVHILVSDQGLAAVIAKDPFDPDKSQLYLDVLKAGGTSVHTYNTWISDSLKDVDDNTWDSRLQNEDLLLDLLVSRYSLGGKFTLGLAYRDAVKQLAERVISGTQTPSHQAILSGSFLDPIWGADRSTVRSRFISAAKEAQGDIPALFFQIFGKDLLEEPDLLGSDQQAVLDLFEPIVAQGNTAGIEWLAHLFHRQPDLLTSYQPSFAVGEFTDRLDAQLGSGAENLTPEVFSALRTLAKALGRDIPELDQASPDEEGTEQSNPPE